MNHKIVAALLLNLAVSLSALAEVLPSKEVELKSYVAVSQVESGTLIATRNEIKTYEVGYNVTKERGACWKVITAETGKKTVPVTLKTGGGEKTFNQQHPILVTERYEVKCTDYDL